MTGSLLVLLTFLGYICNKRYKHTPISPVYCDLYWYKLVWTETDLNQWIVSVLYHLYWLYWYKYRFIAKSKNSCTDTIYGLLVLRQINCIVLYFKTLLARTLCALENRRCTISELETTQTVNLFIPVASAHIWSRCSMD